ncbi:MAG: PbpA [Desulfobacterales bacterium]|nr:PbpA [Desulfobacterales bacterium]
MRFNKFKSKEANLKRPTWKKYQADLKKSAHKKLLIKNILKYLSVLSLLIVLGYAIIAGFSTACKRIHTMRPKLQASESVIDQKEDRLLCKKDVQAILDSKSFLNLKHKSFEFSNQGHILKVDTNLDITLQNFLQEKFDRDTSQYIAIVVMAPANGKILCMVGFDKENPFGNPCINNKFPAASIFKIVTAAAAIEKCGFDLGSKLAYNGRKYTLYKSQLKNQADKFTNKITFQDSFAQSVNPVFGKIGIFYVGKTYLEKYALAFGFNRNINFEILFNPSYICISDKPYQVAEVACGFNRETTISPLHGALMVATILNQGQLIEPTIIDQIVDEKGQTVYQSRPIALNQAISPETSETINALMKATIKHGTCKKTFRGYQRDQILSKLDIGGKTGSIDNQSHNLRLDWFVGFGEEKEGSEKIVISVVVAHEKYMGTRASHYARIAIRYYFSNYFSKNEEKIDSVYNAKL